MKSLKRGVCNELQTATSHPIQPRWIPNKTLPRSKMKTLTALEYKALIAKDTLRIGEKLNSPNELALLDLIADVQETFAFLSITDCTPSDGDMKMLDRAVKKFKTQIWENSFEVIEDPS